MVIGKVVIQNPLDPKTALVFHLSQGTKETWNFQVFLEANEGASEKIGRLAKGRRSQEQEEGTWYGSNRIDPEQDPVFDPPIVIDTAVGRNLIEAVTVLYLWHLQS